MRATIVLVLLVILSGMALADGVGTFTPASERRVDDLTATFRIGVINLADHERKINLRVEDDLNVSVNVSGASLLLPPSRITADPSGSGWLHLGDGRYVKPTFIPLEARINASTHDTNVSFRVDVVTSTVRDTGAGVRQQVVQSRNHRFTVVSSSSRLIPEGGSSDALFRTDDGDEVDQNTTDRSVTGGDEGAGPRQKNITGDDPVRSGDAGVDPVTVALVAAILLVTGSILREVV